MGYKGSIPFITVLMFLCSTLAFSQAVTLREQLSAQYQLAKVSAESGGFAVTTPGTLLTIQQKGVLGVPWKALALCPAKYQDNNFHPSVGFCAGMLKDVSRYFQVGDKVYPVKVEVNVDKGKVSLTFVSCDSCNGINPSTSMKGEVNFQFAKGYLEKAGVGDVRMRSGKCFLSPTRTSRRRGMTPGRRHLRSRLGPPDRCSRRSSSRNRQRFNWG